MSRHNDLYDFRNMLERFDVPFSDEWRVYSDWSFNPHIRNGRRILVGDVAIDFDQHGKWVKSGVVDENEER